MPNFSTSFAILVKRLTSLAVLAASPVLALQNSNYSLSVQTDGSVQITSHGHAETFRPRFTVISAAQNPGLKLIMDKETAFQVPSWKTAQGTTTDFFQAGTSTVIEATKATTSGNTVHWTFAPREDFQLEADLTLPAGTTEPQIHLRFKAMKPGWYSIGYTGAPQFDPKTLNWLWQPLVWQERRFPAHSFFSTEHMCPLPATFVQTGDATIGVVVDPSEVPFRLPTFQNSRFGVVLRNPEGKAQPMAFAPVLGSSDSHLQQGSVVEFKLRLLIQNGDWYATYKHIATNIFSFHDYRHNGVTSLNTTLDNMIDFAMNDAYSGWNEDLKGFDYATDVPGTVKLVSSLHPLSVAILRDDPEIYRRRALPMIEYMMSRQKYLFSMAEDTKGQNPSHLMKGPAAEVSELSALYLISQKRSPVFRYYADLASKTPRRLNLNMISTGDSFQDMLALYRMTGEASYLEKAKTKADAYIAERVNTVQPDFTDVHVETGGQFWTDFASKWVDLLEMYDATHEKRYLDAAAIGAREYTEYVWLQPTVPDGNYTVNKDGKTIISYHSHLNPNPQPIPSPEQSVPAWRVSEIGLTPEASTTYTPNPAVMLTHYAAYMMRLAQYTGDTFFRDIARSAVVGRYESFPGYDINGEFTTTYQRRDYILRPWNQLTYNEIYYNHVWPHIALLFDYLISDAFDRSGGKIYFPARYAQAYAYLQSKVYGDQLGSIYGDDHVQLWMPHSLLQSDQAEVNYISGYSSNTLYLVLTNQSNTALQAHLHLDPNVVPFDANKNYKIRTWQQNKSAAPLQMQNGEVTASIAGKGITVLAIDGLAIKPHFQSEYLDSSIAALPDQSYATKDTSFGPVHSMIFSFGQNLSNSYIWLEATEKEITEARLHYKDGNTWKTVVDKQYPYDFSLPLPEKTTDFDWYVEAVKADGSTAKSEESDLKTH